MLDRKSLDFQAALYILIILVLNTLQSVGMDLSHDEAYYWIYSLAPAWGHYDHPPMVGWLIGLGTFIFGKTELGVRLPFTLMAAAGMWNMWLLGGRRNIGVFVAASMSFPLLIGSGFLALPDTPLMYFSTLFVLLALRFQNGDERFRTVFFLALSIALMFYSKYHGAVIVLLTTAAMPEVLKRKNFWLTVLMVIIFFMPHVLWQYAHDFVSIDFHLNKRSGKGFDIFNVFDYLGGQIALGGILAFLPGIILCAKKARENKVLFANTLGFFLFVLLLSFRNKIEANWTVSAFALLVPYLCRSVDTEGAKKWYIGLSLPAIIALLSFRLVLAMPYENGDYPIERLGEVKGWQSKANSILKACEGFPVYVDTYQIASKLSFYGDKLTPALALGSRESQFNLSPEKALFGNLPAKDDIISYVGSKELEGSAEFDTGYGDPVFVSQGISLKELLKVYGITYEEAIRN